MMIGAGFMLATEACTDTKGFSFSIIMAMSNVGGITYPATLRMLFYNYNYLGGMVLLAAIMSHGFLGAMLFWSHRQGSDKHEEATERTYLQVQDQQVTSTEDNTTQRSSSDSSLRHHPLYLCYCACLGFTFMFSFMSFVTHLSRVYQNNLHDNYDITSLLFTISLIDFSARFVFGFLFDYLSSHVRCINTYTLVVLCLSGSLVTMGLSNTETTMYIATVGVVICNSCCYAQSMTVVMMILPAELVASGVGVLRVFQGAGATIGVVTTGKKQVVNQLEELVTLCNLI